MSRFRLKFWARNALFFGTFGIFWITFIYPGEGMTYLVLLMACISSLFTLIIVEGLPWLIPHLPLRLGHYLNLLRVNLIELFSTTLAFCTLPFPQSTLNPSTDEGGVPTVFIHGYLNNSGVWFYHKLHYRAAGLRNLFAIDLGEPLASIETHAETVRKEVAHIIEITGRNKVRFVCHSMGGLVAAYYALYLSDKEKVEVTDFITMGSPLKGTPWGAIGIGVSSREMTKDSPFIHKLSKKLAKSRVRSFHLGSEADLLVFPMDAAFIKSKGEQKIKGYMDLGHASFLFSDRVINEIIHYLNPI